MPDKKEIVLQKCKNAIDYGEPIMDYSFYYEVIALLKEQEAAEPSTHHHVFICPACKSTLSREQKFCHECGKRIKWEGWEERT